MRGLLRSKLSLITAAACVCLTVAACGNSSSSGSTQAASGSSPGTGTTGNGASAPSAPTISINSFNNSFTALNVLQPLGRSGKGKVAAILPDTTSSTRYVEFDQPMLKQALIAAGVPSSDIIIQNAQGSDSTFLADSKSDVTNGAGVILSDPNDSGTGAAVEKYANSQGVPVIDYDRLTLGRGITTPSRQSRRIRRHLPSRPRLDMVAPRRHYAQTSNSS